MASAIRHSACRDNRSVLYQRVSKLFANLATARGDGRYARIMRTLSGAKLLILDDWGLEPLDDAGRHDLLDDRYGRKSTVVTGQVPVERWQEIIAHPTYADAILDRLVNNAHCIELTGDQQRSENPATLNRNDRATSSESAGFHALFQIGDDPVRNPRIDIVAIFLLSSFP